MPVARTREEGLEQVRELVERYRAHREYLESAEVNETEIRIRFINPLFQALGWDVLGEHLRDPGDWDARMEIPQETEEDSPSKRPDYLFRRGREDAFYAEAKKAATDITSSRTAAFQARQYGYTRTRISVLSNFRHTAIYLSDESAVPAESDDARVARHSLFSVDEYVERWDELWDGLSRETAYSPAFDERWGTAPFRDGSAPFDRYFLEQVNAWRELLARDFAAQDPTIDDHTLSWLVQRFINRLVFLRLCESRSLERHSRLSELDGTQLPFEMWMELLASAERKYNSGLFRLTEDARYRLTISGEVLGSIVRELYLPRSPFNFSVVGADTLGSLYEQFLGKEIRNQHGFVEITDRSDLVGTSGVVPTPLFIAQRVVREALSRLVAGKNPSELLELRIVDPACGSGVFLLEAFDFLVNAHLAWYLAQGAERFEGRQLVRLPTGWQLSFELRRAILENCIFGVDVDPQAVEVTRFSLLLRLIEGEDARSVETTSERFGHGVLPVLDNNIQSGNSLIDHASLTAVLGRITDEAVKQFSPLTWEGRFPGVFERGGFDAVISNPPYVRIQNLHEQNLREAEFYQNAASGYTTVGHASFDKYFLFVERVLRKILKRDGVMGMIIPNPFMRSVAGAPLRELIHDRAVILQIVDFGTLQVFPGKSTYTAIVVVQRSR